MPGFGPPGRKAAVWQSMIGSAECVFVTLQSWGMLWGTPITVTGAAITAATAAVVTAAVWR